MRIDLDAARAARAEELGGGHVVTFGGDDFDLPAEVPFEFGVALLEGRYDDALAVLFGDQLEAFLAHRPSMQDVIELAEGVAGAYGLGSVGEPSASSGSSATNGTGSRPTFNASTA